MITSSVLVDENLGQFEATVLERGNIFFWYGQIRPFFDQHFFDQIKYDQYLEDNFNYIF